MATVLVADDNEEDVKDLVGFIRGKGHAVIYCKNSRDAQGEIRKGHIDCGIYDGKLPRFSDSGEYPCEEWGAAFLVRETKRYFPNMPCVAYTHGLEKRESIEQLRHLNVPVFVKGENRIEEIVRKLGL